MTSNKADTKTKEPRESKPLLPDNTHKAIEMMARLTEGLLEMAERETQALVQNDMFTFAILQNEKFAATEDYARAAGEFRARLESFRGTDKALLEHLETLQARLGEKMKSNNKIVAGLKNKAVESTSGSLFTVQELAQKHPVFIDGKPIQA